MAPRSRLNAVVSRMFGLFLFVVAVGNLLIGQTSFAVLFGGLGFVFVSLSGYILSNPEEFGSDETVSDRLVRAVVLGGWALVLVSAILVAALALS